MESSAARTATEQFDTELLGALRRYWGYDSFRPMQERIVRSLLGGQDACVVMPTGGGKSLCYQLPAALLAERTVVVVSPLIALMQDQVAQLGQMGISAALLNSTLDAREQSEILREAIAGRYRLLYLSPERLARADTIEWLQRVPVSLFAIDEAHCISEWGHEFRPEYRQLSSLRKNFPECPIAAFTASATRQVRHDIIEQLALREPHKYIASFHRANLRYVVKQCDAGTQSELLVRALRSYAGSNVIVYSPTIARVEETVAFLAAEGIRAIGYHGKMDSATRRRNQEKWMSDEVPVLVGTVAFGLGINKAAVRAVIHLSLPKSMSSITRKRGARGVTVCLRIVCCCGRREMRGCWRILSSSSAIRRNTKEPGSAITSSALLLTPRVAGIGKSVCILVKLRNGRRAELAMCAATKSAGFVSRWLRRGRSGARGVPRRNALLQLLRGAQSRSRAGRIPARVWNMSCRRAQRRPRLAPRAQAGGVRRRSAKIRPRMEVWRPELIPSCANICGNGDGSRPRS